MAMETGRARWRAYPLRLTLPIDGSGSFLLPVLVLAAVPVLAALDVSPVVMGLVAIGSAVVLGGCGVVMAVAMARTMLRGDHEHPEMARFLRRSARHV